MFKPPKEELFNGKVDSGLISSPLYQDVYFSLTHITSLQLVMDDNMKIAFSTFMI